LPRKTIWVLGAATLVGLPLSLWVAIELYWPNADLVNAHGYYVGQDFVNFWTAGRLAFAGRIADIYAFDAFNGAIRALLPPASGFLVFSYPPHFLVVLATLGALPYLVALGLFHAAGIAAFAWLCVADATRGDAARFAPIAVISPIVLLVATVGQTSFLLALLFVGGLRLVPTRPVIAGAMFGLLTVKPQLGVLLPPALLLMGERRAFVSAVISTIGLVAISLALFGIEPWHDYLTVTLAYQQRVIAEMSGLYPIMMVTPYAALWQIGVPTGIAMAVHAVIAVAVAAASLHAVVRASDAGLRIAVLAIAAVIVTPYCLNYDLAIPLAATAMWLTARPAPHWSTLAAVAALWALPYVGMLLALWHLPLVGMALLASFAVLYREAVLRPDLPPESS
jgi:hypothetical protein